MNKWMTRITKVKNIKLLVIIIVFIFPPIAILMVSVGLKYSARDRIYAPQDVPSRKAVLILGARIYPDGRMSPILRDRVLTGIELYADGKAGKILMSGDHGRAEYDEVNSAKRLMLDMRVPAEDIFLDYAGFDTYDSIYRAKIVFGAVDLIIVTQAYHLPRALLIARGLGLDAVGVAADKQEYAGMEYFKRREVLANIKAASDLMFKSKPRFLGPSLPISGDGRSSWDESSFPIIHE